MTSDGISSDDWTGVHERALEIVNAGDDALADHYRIGLLDYLDSLDRKYGELPSLLATRADYVEDPRESERLLLRAYECAVERSDERNALLVAQSLAELYLDAMLSKTRRRPVAWPVRETPARGQCARSREVRAAA